MNFRGGRVDATQAGPPGVPSVEFDIQSLTESFARQGFTPTEMIQLVACGHSIGGVTRQDFPNVPPKCRAHRNAAELPFDSSPGVFDNKMYV
jgi:hypothetical protein